MAEPKIRIGVIGAGNNTRKMHLPGFQSIPGVEVTVVCNRSRASSAKAAADFNIPAVAEHWREVTDSPNVDAVLIGTWPYLHAEATIGALEAGKHVLTEARMARNLDEALRMEEAGGKHPGLVKQIVPAPMSLGVDPTVKEMLSEGRLGDLREILVIHTTGGLFREETPLGWRQDENLSGLNILSMGIYHEMTQRWLETEPEWVAADGAVFTRERIDENGKTRAVNIPDSVSILGRMAGARLLYHFSGVEPSAHRNEIRLNGSRGSLRFDVAADRLWFGDGREEREITIPAEKRPGWRVEADFIDSIREGKPVRLTSFADGARYMRFTEAVNRSLKDGARPVILADLP